MAIKLEDKPGVQAPNVAYPFGRPKDNSGSNDGMPLNVLTHGDFHQFFAKMMAESGIVYNDQPDNATDGFQYWLALVEAVKNNCAFFDDISSSSTLYAGITGTLKVHRWRDGTIEVMVTGSYAADLTPTTKIVDNLPLSISAVQTVPVWITGVSGELGRNIAFTGITGELKAGGSTSIPVSGYGAIQIYFTYKEAV